MNAGQAHIGLVLLASLAGWSGCRSGPLPEQLAAEATALSQRYDKRASERAAAMFLDAASAWRKAGNPAAAARAGRDAGDTFWQLGLVRRSLDAYRAALMEAQAAPDRLLESELLSRVGTVAALASEPASESHCQRALSIARQLSAVRETARAMNCLGEAAYFNQHLNEALAHQRDAERLWRLLGDQRGLAQTLLMQGYVYSDVSRFDLAQDCFRRARTIWIALGDQREQAITLVAFGRLSTRRGEYQLALNDFNEALATLVPMGSAAWEGGALTGLAEIRVALGEVRQALVDWERATQLFETSGLEAISLDILMSLGGTYLVLGQDQEALDRFTRALERASAVANDRWRALALRDVATVHLFRRQPGPALTSLQASLDAQRELDDPRLAAATRADLGVAHNLLGDHDQAAHWFREALALSRAGDDRVEEGRIHFGFARAALGRSDLAAARRHAEQAIAVVESLRTAVEHRELRLTYFASVHEYYELHLDILMRLHQARRSPDLASAAFEASERARARSLLESLAEASVDLRAGVEPDLLRREEISRAALGDWALRRRRSTGTATGRHELVALAREFRTLEDRYLQTQAEIRSRSPRYAALVHPRVLDLKAVQSELLDPDTLLLEYALGDERSYLWAITRGHQLTCVLPPRVDIERTVRRVHDLVTARLTTASNPRERDARARQADADYWVEARRLSEMLLAPASSLMAGKRIVIVADGALQYLPFAALPLPGSTTDPEPLIVAHEVVSLPSASVLAALRRDLGSRPRATGVVAVLADPVFEHDDPRVRHLSTRGLQASAGAASMELPRLASTRQESDAIIGIARPGPSLRRVDFAASRATAMSQELGQYRIVHFATHGVLDNETPGLSGIALSMFDERGQPQDGFLRLHDIYGLRLPVELVVLSACDTALGRLLRGEGLVGLVRGFMYAGAPRVVASLWKVDDEATSELMTRFYREMLEQGRSPAAALRLAQRSMWRHSRWHEPYHWAAFVLQGEWR